MDLIIIIVFIILILSCMITAYVPYELQSLAKKAGFSKFSLRFCLLRIQRIPIKYLFEQYVKLVDANVSIEFEEFKKYLISKPDKLENTVNIIINAKIVGIELPINEIEKYNLTKENSLKFFSILKKINDYNLNYSQTDIFNLIDSKIDLNTYFKIIEKAGQHNIDITNINIDKINLHELSSYIDILINANKNGIDTKNISDTNFSLKAKNILLSNLLKIKQSGINISEEELLEIHKSGIDTSDYIESVKFIQTEEIKNIDKQKIKEHYLKGGNSKAVIEAILFARANKSDISTSKLFNLDLIEGTNIKELIKKAVIPYEVDLNETNSIILPDGIQIIPKIKLKITENINASSYLEKEVFFDNIKKVLSSEILNFKTYKDVLNNIQNITKNTFDKINENEDYEDSTYFLKNIIFSDIEIKSNILSDLNDNSKINEENAKLKLLNSKIKMQEDISEAFKNGKISFKDYQKEKHIFNSFDEGELPYTD